MTITIELRRVGMSTVSYAAIPLEARVLQGGQYGENLLKGRWTDPVGAKREIYRLLTARFGRAVTVEWMEIEL
jgi:hypothetical protein